MRPLESREIVGLSRYGELRGPYRQAVIAHKRSRRVSVGESATLLFEDRETLRFQVQEMLWVERIEDPEKLQHELDVYNELMPGPGELSATLFIEIADPARIRSELDRLVGIDEHVALRLGEEPQERAIRARFDPKQMEEDRISAVQYIRFSLDEAERRLLADPSVPAALCIDHPHYRRRCELSETLRASLLADLAGEPEPLLRADAAPAAGDRPGAGVAFASGNVRAVWPAQPRAPGHLVVEPREPGPSLLEIDAALLAELMEAVRRAARQVTDAHGSCRVTADLDPSADRLRWHVFAGLD